MTKGWAPPFENPIKVDGRDPATLLDSGEFIAVPPKREHDATEWQSTATGQTQSGCLPIGPHVVNIATTGKGVTTETTVHVTTGSTHLDLTTMTMNKTGLKRGVLCSSRPAKIVLSKTSSDLSGHQ